MRSRSLYVIALLSISVLPAQSEPPIIETHTLTLIDSLPTKAQLQAAFSLDPVPELTALALSSSTDFGVRLRAIRSLPQFCTATAPACKDDSDAQMHPIRTAVRNVITSVPSADQDGRSMLRLRAGIEALGVIASGEQSDVDLLVPLLNHQSRDIRFATARALRELCIQSAETPLRNRYEQETVPQVRLAISAALGELVQCSQ